MFVGWARREIADTLNKAFEWDVAAFARAPAEMEAHAEAEGLERPKHLVLGPGAYLVRPHADGVGDYCMNSVIMARQPNGRLRTHDLAAQYDEEKDIDLIREWFGGEDCSDQELLSVLAHGVQSKARWPRELRILHTLNSFVGRGAKAVSTAQELLEAFPATSAFIKLLVTRRS